MNTAMTTTSMSDANRTDRRYNRAANALYTELIETQPTFTVDTENSKALQACANWLIGNPTPDVGKGQGLLLTGPVGTGKTYLMMCLARTMRRAGADGFEVVNVKRIEKEYNRSDDGSKDANKMGGDHVVMRYAMKRHICFDDLAIEEDGKHYGRRANIMADIIALRYEAWRKGEVLTHFTTNATPQMLEERYDNRTLTRLMEMCGEVYLGGPCRRLIAAAPVRQYVMPGLFEVKPQREMPTPEQFSMHVDRLRNAVQEAASVLTSTTKVIDMRPSLTKEQEAEALRDAIPGATTEQLLRMRDNLLADGADMHAEYIGLIQKELAERTEQEQE
jgi:energy-coupling factor transporter ATP-binding protein EcfA2